MKGKLTHIRRPLGQTLLTLFALMLVTSGSWSTGAVASAAATGATGATGSGNAGQSSAPNAISCPDGQCFTDVPSTNTFSSTINSLYMDGIISGYPCGGTGEPCDSQNRPYYRPGATVTRGQMSKFVDNGRRNIADAVGLSLDFGAKLA